MSPTNEETQKRESIISRSYILLCISNILLPTAQMMLVTLLPVYANDLGADSTTIGLVAGAFAITAIIFGPLVTPAFDAFSKKKIYICTMIFVTINTFCYSFANTVGMVIVVRLLHGCAMGVTGAVALAWVSSILPRSRVGFGISIYSMGQALAEALGPASGLWLASMFGYANAFRASSCLMLIGTILLFFCKENKLIARRPYKFSISRIFAKKSLPAGCIALILAGANSCIMGFLVIYGNSMGIESISLYFVVAALFLVVMRPIYGKLADKFGYTKIIILGLICFTTAFVLISQARTLPVFICAAAISSCGYGACLPLIQAMCMQSSPLAEGGTAGSTYFVCINTGQFIAPFALGAVAQSILGVTGNVVMSYSWMYLILAAIVVASLGLFLAIRKKIYRNMEEASVADESAGA